MGVTKEVLKAGNGSKPSAGQQVTVHCTGYGKNQDLSKKFWCKSFLFLRLRFGWCTVAGLGSTVVSPLSVLYYYTVPSSETMNASEERLHRLPSLLFSLSRIEFVCLFFGEFLSNNDSASVRLLSLAHFGGSNLFFLLRMNKIILQHRHETIQYKHNGK